MVYPVTWPLWALQVASEAESCISGATVSGDTISIGETTDIENICDYPVFFEVLLVGGGGGGGITNDVGGGGGAGGAVGADSLNPVRAFINPGEVVTVTVGEGGAAGSDGDDTILWVDPDTGQALDPLTDTAPSDYQAFGGGAGNAGDGGSGGGGGADFPVSGGTTNNGGNGTLNQGSDGGAGKSGGGLSTCQDIAGGGGGSYAGAGQDGTGGTPSEGGDGGAGTVLPSWGVTLGSGGGGGSADRIQGSGEGICGPDTQTAGVPGSGVGAGGGGIAPTLSATPGQDGVVVFKNVGFSRKLDQTSSGKIHGWIGGGDSRLDAFDDADWSTTSGSFALDGSGNLVLTTSSNALAHYSGETVNEVEMLVQADLDASGGTGVRLGLLALWSPSPIDGMASLFTESNGDFFLSEFTNGSGASIDFFDGNGNSNRKVGTLWADDTDAAALMQGTPLLTVSSAQTNGGHSGSSGFRCVTSSSMDLTIYRLIASSSRYITVSGLEVDWVIKVRDENGDTVVSHTATGTSEDIDIYDIALGPYETIIIYDTDGVTPISAIAPPGGIWGGDVYEVQAEE